MYNNTFSLAYTCLLITYTVSGHRYHFRHQISSNRKLKITPVHCLSESIVLIVIFVLRNKKYSPLVQGSYPNSYFNRCHGAVRFWIKLFTGAQELSLMLVSLCSVSLRAPVLLRPTGSRHVACLLM